MSCRPSLSPETHSQTEEERKQKRRKKKSSLPPSEGLGEPPGSKRSLKLWVGNEKHEIPSVPRGKSKAEKAEVKLGKEEGKMQNQQHRVLES